MLNFRDRRDISSPSHVHHDPSLEPVSCLCTVRARLGLVVGDANAGHLLAKLLVFLLESLGGIFGASILLDLVSQTSPFLTLLFLFDFFFEVD